MIPRTFGPYEIETLLGRGGMGDVYRARDTRRERLVALKLLPEIFSDDAEYLSRFRREQHVAARLREPHVIPIHDFGEIDGRVFIDMRLVDGKNVCELLEEGGPLPPARAVNLVSQVAEALAAAHSDGLVHRDVKPSNVLVTPRDFVYVVDFGIARSIGMTRTSLTITGATVGTLDYMAPERFTSLPIDGRADIYSLACLLHECLTSTRPFRGEDLASLMHAHLYSSPPRPSNLTPGVPPAMDAVISRGMAKHPDERFASALDLAAAAREALQSTDPVSHRASTERTPTRVITEAPEPAAGTEPAVSSGPAASAEPTETATAETAPAAAADEPTTPRPAAAPMPVSGWGVQSADGSHRSVDRLPEPAPTTVRPAPPAPAPPASAAAARPPEPAVVPPTPPDDSGIPGQPPGPPDDEETEAHEPAGRRPVGRGLAVLATVAAVLVAVLVAVFLLGGPDEPGSGDAAGSGPSASGEPSGEPTPTTEAPPPPPAASIPIPAAGAAVPVGDTPGYVQVAPNGRYAYITNRDAGVVTVLDTTLDSVTATIPIEAGPPRFVTFSPDGKRAYVTVYNEEKTVNAVVFLDTATLDVLKTVPVGRRPFAPATTPDGRLLYVPSHDDGEVEVLDTATGEIVDRIVTPPNPHWVVFSSDGRTFYTADHESGVVTAFDTGTNDLVATIPVGRAPHSLAISPDGSRLSVVNYDSNTLSVIDTASHTVLQTVDLDLRPQDVTYAPDGAHLYTANVDGGTVDVIDTATGNRTARIPTGKSPTSISVLPDGRRAYVTNLDDGTVRILDIAAV
jgi:YVTN family beta-propeller protein